jgi:hypothetical protein
LEVAVLKLRAANSSRQANGQTGKPASGQAGKQTSKQANKQASKQQQTSKQAECVAAKDF